MNPRLLLCSLALCFASLCVRADTPPAPEIKTAPVTSVAALHQHYQQVLARPEFHEAEDFTGDYPFRDWFSQWMSRLISRFQDLKYAGEMSGLAWLLITSMTALALVGLIYVLVRLSRRHRDSAGAQENAATGEKTFLSPRLYDEKLLRAIEQRDWHAAWLATWLQFLSRLELRRLVEPDRSRTNREYLAQLQGQQLPAPTLPLLTELVEDYDRFVYGLRVIDEPVWRAFHRQIDELSLMLHLRNKAPSAPATEEAA